MTGEALITTPFGVGAVVAALIALTFWLDQRFRMFSFLGTAILVITGAALLVNARVIPPSVPVGDQGSINPFYVFANDYCVPVAIVLLLATADLRSLRRLGGAALFAWGLAAAGTLLGTAVAVVVLSGAVGPESWKLGGMYAASYIGGGVNYTAVGEAVNVSDTLFATGAAADTIMTNVWMVATAIIPVVFIGFYPSIYDRSEATRGAAEEEAAPEAFWQKTEVSIYDLVYLAAVVFAIVAVAEAITNAVAALLGFEVPIEIWYTTLALLAALTPINRLNGGTELGNFLLHIFFAALGAGTVLSTLAGEGPTLFLFLVILVSIHALVVFGVGRLRKIDIETLCVASQATVGGPSTALALAVSKRWSPLVTPAVLLGVLGYATGNYIGIGVAYLLRSILG